MDDNHIDADARHRLIEETHAAYAALKADPEAWADYQEEIAVLDGTLMDGLDE